MEGVDAPNGARNRNDLAFMRRIICGAVFGVAVLVEPLVASFELIAGLIEGLDAEARV